MTDQKITIQYIAAGILAVAATWFLHEFVHWLTSELLGYKTVMWLNGTAPIKGQNPTAVHQAIISISAPIITVLQGVFVFYFLKLKGWHKQVYPLLFTAFYMRLLAGLMNFIMPNDEARVGQFLGIGTFTISIVFSAFLFLLVYKSSRNFKLTGKFHLWTTLIILVASSVLILIDQTFKIRIL